MKKSIYNLIKVALLVIFSCSLNVYSQQNILISQGGTVNVNDGDKFYDEGGPSGNYPVGKYVRTITLKPAFLGESVCLDFLYFKTFLNTNMIDMDKLEIFDGISTTSPNIGSLQGDYSAKFSNATTPACVGLKAQPEVDSYFRPGVFCANNPTGSLTLRFTTTGSGVYSGWEASISTFRKSFGCNIDITVNDTTIDSGNNAKITVSGNITTPIMNNDFNSGMGNSWKSTPTFSLVNRLMCEPNNGYTTINTDKSQYLWVQNAIAPRKIETIAFDVSQGGMLSFDYRQASDDNGSSGCEVPDFDEAVYVQYSTDNGTTWKIMKALFANDGGVDLYKGCGDFVCNWSNIIVPIPSSAFTNATMFRWIQAKSTSATTDNWGLDNIKITANNTKTITITNVSTGEIIGSSTSSPYSLDVSPTTTTTYMAMITDGFSTATNEITINVTPSGCTPPTVDVGKDTTICLGNNVQLNVNTIGTYAWSPATGLDAANISSPIATPTVTTTYSIVVTAQGGCSNSDTIIITVNDCDNLSQKDTVANDTTGIKIDNVITVSIDTCVFNYNAPLDSFKIIGYSITQTDLILNWVFYQHPNVITVNSKTPLVSIKDGNNLVYLTIQCTKNKSLRSIYKNVFITNFNYVGTTGIKKTEEAKLQVFPNPTSGMLNIVLPSTLKTGATLELYTIDSKKLLSLKVNQQSNAIDMSPYPAGVYMLKVISEEGTMIERISKN